MKGGGKTLSYDAVKKTVEAENFKLLNGEYINSLTKLELQCPAGHVFRMVYSNFQRGSRCRKCYDKKNAIKRRIDCHYKKEDFYI